MRSVSSYGTVTISLLETFTSPPIVRYFKGPPPFSALSFLLAACLDSEPCLPTLSLAPGSMTEYYISAAAVLFGSLPLMGS